MSTELLSQQIITWYRANARVLPWRKDTDPYHVWISEIMLQQTRIETVIAYYQRFMERLPSLQDLAEVPMDELLKLWEGLGYYSRARNLKKAAEKIITEYHGLFPDDVKEIIKLPGIGEYTCGAIASICFNQPVCAIDGNVTRVFSRYYGKDFSENNQTRKELKAVVTSLYPEDHCGDFTQGIMELGETICIPNGIPKCEICPLRHQCIAHRNHQETQYPLKQGKKPRKEEIYTVLLLYDSPYLFVQKRKETGLLANLYEPLNFPGKLTEKQIKEILKELPVTDSKIQPLPKEKHIFSHIEWVMYPWRIDCDMKYSIENCLDLTGKAKDKSIPTAFKKLMKYL